ncbi:hypothetical protein GCM10009347_16150 [Shewanella algicola]|uniref:Uncharacterized protein n=1 Tax=Shewanella algicola TaxID=640633 RepID=A0A9X1Z5C8_9GAMM|nr:hypothetical protein [Shewanella algicola]MCL1105870.1 hypothetical protein [Shewanella algicola]GGP49887.1 hypothetical protein GCM10009347_16150 [Shewanella algicola]
MEDQLDKQIDMILKAELIYIEKNALSILQPQSDEAKELHVLYCSSIENDQYHNHNIGSLSLGEIEKYSLKEVDIPTFNQFVYKRLTEHGYNKSRFNQIILNTRDRFQETDQYDPRYDKFANDLRSVCESGYAIAEKLVSNELSLASNELAELKQRFSRYWPEISNPFEAKPGFFGFSIDLFKLLKIFRDYVSSKKT